MQKLKLTLGILMVAALFVPLSRCSHGGTSTDAPPTVQKGLQKIFPRSDARTEIDYGATRLDLSPNGALTLVAFGWPLLLALLGRRVRGKRHARVLWGLELLLCAGTIWWMYAITEGATRLWGAYFVVALIGAYAITALVDLFGASPDD